MVAVPTTRIYSPDGSEFRNVNTTDVAEWVAAGWLTEPPKTEEKK